MKRSIKSAALVLAAGLTLSLGACAQKPAQTDALEKITFVLDYTPNTNHTGLYVARQQGFFKEAGLEVEIIQPPEDGATVLVGGGKAQFGISFQETMSAALTSDAPLPVVAVAAIIDHNTSGILSEKSKGIDSFKNMEGKTYATWQTPLEQAVLKEVMAAQGGDFDKLTLVPSNVTDAVSAIQTNIDCLWVYEGWDMTAAKLAGVDYNYISFRDVAPVLDFYTPVIIANESYLNENPETAKKFMAAVAKGYEFAIEKPDEAASILCEAVPELPKDMILESQRFLAGEYKAEKEKWGYIDQARWAAFYDWSYEKGLITKPLGEKGFTNDYLP